MKLRYVLMGAAASALCASAALAERGTDGELNIIYWQAPSTEPLSFGGHQGSRRRVAGPRTAGALRRGWQHRALHGRRDPDRRERRHLRDLNSITWKLKPDLKWSDGTPVTAEDAVFTWQYCTDPGRRLRPGRLLHRREIVEAVDDQTLKITFDEAKPFPYTAFVGAECADHAEAQFKDCLGARGAGMHRCRTSTPSAPARSWSRNSSRTTSSPSRPTELPRPGQAGLRDRAVQGRRRRGLGGALGSRNRRI